MKNRTILFIAIAVVIVAAIAAVSFSVLSGSGSGSTTTITNQNTSVFGGPGQSYMSSSEMRALFGSGVYSASAETQNATMLAQYVSSSNQTFLQGNITSMWYVMYNITGSPIFINTTASINPFAYEVVYRSPVASTLYGDVFRSNIDIINSTNVGINKTEGGLTYSYAQYTFYNVTVSAFLGQKNDTVAYLVLFGKNVSMSSLAATVNADMP